MPRARRVFVRDSVLVLCILLSAFLAPRTTFSQAFRVDEFSVSEGIVELSWETTLRSVYSLESSTNLLDWLEVKGRGVTGLRFTGTASNRLSIEMSDPSSRNSFFRVRKHHVVDVVAAPEGDDVQLRDVNDAGRVVGFFSGRLTEGFTWTPGGAFVGFGPGTRAVAVNQQDIVVGLTNSSSTGGTYFFSWTMSDGVIVHGEGIPVDVNASGHILGYEVVARVSSRAFLWKPGVGKTYLPHLDAVSESTVPHALSDAGHVVGDSLIDKSYYRAFYWTEAGGMVDVANAQSNAVDVNNSGQVIGQRVLSDGTSRCYVWTAAGGIVNLPASVSYPSDINDQGQVTGSYSSQANHAFLWSRGGGLVGLGGLTPIPGLTNGSASNGLRVNENGHVIGDSQVYYPRTDGSFSHPFYWSPGTGMVRLETLTVGNAGAVLISKNGMVYGYGMGSESGPGSRTTHVLMWDMSNPP